MLTVTEADVQHRDLSMTATSLSSGDETISFANEFPLFLLNRVI